MGIVISFPRYRIRGEIRASTERAALLAGTARQTLRDAVEAIPELMALGVFVAAIACCAKWAGA